MKALRYVVPIAVFAVVCAFLFVGLGRDPRTLPSPLIGRPAPAFTLPKLDGSGTAGLDAYRGRPVLLNLFASWCQPCLQEHPVLTALAQRRLVPVFGIAYKDARDATTRWLSRHGNPFTDVVSDESGRVGIDFGVYGVPETYLIDADGVIRFKHVGPLTQDVVERDVLPLLRGQPR